MAPLVVKIRHEVFTFSCAQDHGHNGRHGCELRESKSGKVVEVDWDYGQASEKKVQSISQPCRNEILPGDLTKIRFHSRETHWSQFFDLTNVDDDDAVSVLCEQEVGHKGQHSLIGRCSLLQMNWHMRWPKKD